MISTRNRPIRLTLKLFRALARAFPYEFKNTYGEDLVGVAEDAIEPIWRSQGIRGLLGLLLDIAIRIPAEHLAELGQDVRYGLRMLRGSPAFTLVALVSVGLGICIASCAYSELHGLVLRDIPGVLDPGRLVALQMPASYPNYQRYALRTDLFSSSAAYLAPAPFIVSDRGYTERVWGHLITPSYFDTLGVHPALGRFFQAQDQQRREAPQAVISFRYWQNHLASDPFIIGKTLRINGRRCTITGVAPRDFLGASPTLFVADLWLPLSVGANVAPELAGNVLERHDLTMFHVVARLAPGVSDVRAEAALDALARQAEQDYGDPDRYRKDRRVTLLPGGKVLPVRKQDLPFFTDFFLILGGMVLLIACSNVANMMFARTTGRRKEIAVRLSLGASRARLMRQLLTETMLISAAAGLVGFLLSIWIMRRASELRMSYAMPVIFDLTPDWHAFLFTLGLIFTAALAFGLLPAWKATRTDFTPALKEGGAVRLHGFRRLTLRNALMLVQLAGSLTLLTLTGTLVLGFQSSFGANVGLTPQNLYLVAVDPARDGYSSQRATVLLHTLLHRLQASPGVVAACLTDTVALMPGGTPPVTFSSDLENNGSRAVHYGTKYIVGHDYFKTTEIPILEGREFSQTDETPGSAGVIVSQALVAQLWHGEDALGRELRVGAGAISPSYGVDPGTIDFRDLASANRLQTVRVVGVAADVAQGYGIEKPPPAIYFPLRSDAYAHPSARGFTIMVRVTPGMDAIRIIRREISSIGSGLTAFDARSMLQQIGVTLFAIRVAAGTYAFIGICGLILASVGLAGLTAYSVAQRVREIGIRMALGAQRRDVLGLVMKEAVALIFAGTAIGLACAWAGMRFLSSVFNSVAKSTTAVQYGVLLVVVAPLLLACFALLASYLPARRSVRIDPLVALRHE